MESLFQIGLHVWLLMQWELIFMLPQWFGRCSPLFELTIFTLSFITYVGILTSIFAASLTNATE